MANQRVDRESYWHEIMEDWSESDLSQRRFCGARKLGYSAFCYWRRRLAKLDGSRGASKKADGPSIHPFIPVEVKPSGPAGSRLSYEVTLESGCRISVPFHFEPESLERLIEVLEGRLCLIDAGVGDLSDDIHSCIRNHVPAPP